MMRARNIIAIAAALIAAVLLAACSRNEGFVIQGSLTDGSSTNLYIKYYSGDAVNSVVTVARDGDFRVKIRVKQPALVEILDKEYRVIATLYAEPGKEVEAQINPADPFALQLKGSKVNEQWCQLLAEIAPVMNGGRPRDINDYISDYVAEHPDNVLSAMLFMCYYDASLDPVKAEKVLDSLSEDVRLSPLLTAYTMMSAPYVVPGATDKVSDFKYRPLDRDTVLTVRLSAKPLTVIAVSDEYSNRRDSVIPRLREIWDKEGASRVQIIDIGLYNDTTMWRGAVSSDSVPWTRAWVPGGILGDALSPLAIPAIPYYIVADSTGRQVYRSPLTPMWGDHR